MHGQKLGQYELVEKIGEGGLATVYKAYQPNLDRWVAIKMLHVTTQSILDRFEREAKAVALLRHPNILVVHEFNKVGEQPYIAMEYVENGTLDDRLQDEPMDHIRLINLIISVAEALHYAHEQGLIHRDVKPSNILMPTENWPLLADFGMVKVKNPEKAITTSDDLMGTPAYISPEQANQSKSVDRRADIYSLGVVMFQMITGRLPFDDSKPLGQVMAHLYQQPPSPSQFNPKCPPALEMIILKAMAKAPDERYSDMQGLADDLKEIFNAANIAARLLLPEQNVTIDLTDPLFAGNSLIIGRTYGSARADIDLNQYCDAIEVGISRRHARLIRQGHEWLVEDLDSLNGTYVNEVKIKPGTPVPLKNNDQVRCSLFSFQFLTTTDS